jgi:hypothetical protein
MFAPSSVVSATTPFLTLGPKYTVVLIFMHVLSVSSGVRSANPHDWQFTSKLPVVLTNCAVR